LNVVPLNSFLFKIALAIAELAHLDSTFSAFTIEIDRDPIFDSV